MLATAGLPGSLARGAVSLFIAVNLATVVFMNLPQGPLGRAVEDWTAQLSPENAHRVRQADWGARWYAHLVGLDNQWQMFGWQPRYQWWYTIKGRYENGSEVVLPLPLQSERSLAERLFWDFKDAKIYLNLYRRPEWRQAFAHYLCRRYPVHEGASIRAIVYELHWQTILSPEDARKNGDHLAQDESSLILHIVYRP